jgi:hypothetical protein
VAVYLAVPGWLGDSGVHELPDRPLLMLDIFLNNLLLALMPLFGGWLAAGHLNAGRRLVAGGVPALARGSRRALARDDRRRRWRRPRLARGLMWVQRPS